jgi:hypothetical protein
MWFTGVGGNRIGEVGDGPPLATITRARIRAKARTASFSFAAPADTGFQCALTKGSATPHYAGCGSPRNYRGLKPASYTFEVRALNGATHGSSARKSFRIG